METTTARPRILIPEQLEDELSAGYHKVLRSEDGRCIYKLLSNIPDNESIYLTVSVSNSSFLLVKKTTIKGEIRSAMPGTWYESNLKSSIQLLVAGQTPKPVKEDGFYYHGIQIGSLKIGLPHYARNKETTELVTQGEKLFIKIWGCDFPIEWFERENHYYRDDDVKASSQTNKARKVYSNLKSLPVKFTRESLRDYIGKKFSVEAFADFQTKGITKAYANIAPYFESLIQNDKAQALAFRLFIDAVGRTVESVSISTLFNKVFGNVTTEKEFLEIVSRLTDVMNDENSHDFISDVLKKLDEAREVKKTSLKRKSTGAFNKIMDDLDFVNIDKEKFPKTHEAVHSGTLPLGTFFRKGGESYFVYNDNWALWEKMLTHFPEVSVQLANTVSGRSTYEKDLMSYFYFVLYRLPNYLWKHTGKTWTCSPRLVNSSNELDPPKEGETGTAKTRSALTPIVDNEKNHVVVPYVSMKIPGYSTTYCYGLDYNLLEEGFSFKGNVVTEEIEKLNGRDNYGLMFYTLTGSSQGRGYPTFLIIFEEVRDGIRVHFHRTHPFRSKDGDYNPVHGWIRGCYKWMIGNVNYERIKAQQGDLAFVQIDEFPDGEVTEVNSYDSHCFGEPVKFTPYVKKDKQNVLGYVQILEDTTLKHTEHLARKVPAGNYEIRQCRSWEANPKGVWSLRID